MTYEEAIKAFKPITDNEAYTDNFQDACKMAIEALKKQIPKKPKEIVTDDNEYICTLCPICNARVDDDGRGYEQPYCMECGQAIDWSEEE